MRGNSPEALPPPRRRPRSRSAIVGAAVAVCAASMVACGSDEPAGPEPPVTLQPGALCSDFSGTDIATFADANLDGAVRDALGISASDDLTCATLAGLTTLQAWSLGITSLLGLQNATGLVTLSLDGNAVGDLRPITGLSSLSRLGLESTSLVDVTPLAALTSLDTLHVGDNAIVDISPLASLTGLTKLAFDGNSVTSIAALAPLTAMTALNFKGNSISDIGVLSSMTGLTQLETWGNQIVDVSPLSGLTTLVFLDLDNNNISDISPIAGLVNVEHLDIGDNAFTDISSLSALTKLERLDLEDLGVTDIGVVSNFTDLRALTAQRNDITDIGALQALTSLAAVRLDGNASLSNVGPLLANAGIGLGDGIQLEGTSVSCADVDALLFQGAMVSSDCPTPVRTVSVDDNFFSPVGQTIAAGDSVTWTWSGTNMHNVTFSTGSSSATQSAGTFTRSFDTGGTYAYQCTIHAGMTGTIVALDD